eukprot:jgi/Ulvmu1/620/UM001_0628.1
MGNCLHSRPVPHEVIVRSKEHKSQHMHGGRYAVGNQTVKAQPDQHSSPTNCDGQPSARIGTFPQGDDSQSLHIQVDASAAGQVHPAEPGVSPTSTQRLNKRSPSTKTSQDACCSDSRQHHQSSQLHVPTAACQPGNCSSTSSSLTHQCQPPSPRAQATRRRTGARLAMDWSPAGMPRISHDFLELNPDWSCHGLPDAADSFDVVTSWDPVGEAAKHKRLRVVWPALALLAVGVHVMHSRHPNLRLRM